MTTRFKNALSIAGLSLQEASTFFNVRRDTVRAWCSGKNQVPDGIWLELAGRVNAIINGNKEELDEKGKQMADVLDYMLTLAETEEVT